MSEHRVKWEPLCTRSRICLRLVSCFRSEASLGQGHTCIVLLPPPRQLAEDVLDPRWSLTPVTSAAQRQQARRRRPRVPAPVLHFASKPSHLAAPPSSLRRGAAACSDGLESQLRPCHAVIRLPWHAETIGMETREGQPARALLAPSAPGDGVSC